MCIPPEELEKNKQHQQELLWMELQNKQTKETGENEKA